ncbi:putative secretory pathway GDP dissociation inhibitor 1 [Diplonema papillatum]|nr:putative secretory pathway GDP dissociation inhibitor 1 [Diplonema papillatum]
MEEEYDCVVCGTGLIECVLSGLLSVAGHKVLHLDRNEYYGGECASLNLSQLYANFGKEMKEGLGKPSMYNVDMIPKFLMADGELVKILRATVVSRYEMQFMLCDCSFVTKGNNIYKVPCTEKEALGSSLMGILEKRRAAKFFAWSQDCDENNPKTWGKLRPKEQTMREIFAHFGLSKDTIEFIGHAIALEEKEDYLDEVASKTLSKILLYESSLGMYEGGTVSPFVYPLYGLGELPQVFARLSAVYGGTYMLNTPVEKMVFTDDGEFAGVVADGGKLAKAKFVVGDPTYFPDRVTKIGQVARAICLMDKPLDGIKSAQSAQIIIPHSQVKPPRKHDIYVVMLSEIHKVVPQGKYLAIVSTFAETANPEEELAPGLALCGKHIIDKFVSVSPLYEPNDDGSKSKCYISDSYDSSSHFEAAAANILKLYEKITGKPYDFDKSIAQPVSM